MIHRKLAPAAVLACMMLGGQSARAAQRGDPRDPISLPAAKELQQRLAPTGFGHFGIVSGLVNKLGGKAVSVPDIRAVFNQCWWNYWTFAGQTNANLVELVAKNKAAICKALVTEAPRRGPWAE